jgi:hypothetical protein
MGLTFFLKSDRLEQAWKCLPEISQAKKNVRAFIVMMGDFDLDSAEIGVCLGFIAPVVRPAGAGVVVPPLGVVCITVSLRCPNRQA